MEMIVTNWPLTQQEEARLLANERFLNLSQPLKLTTGELQELSRVLMLKVIYSQPEVPMQALTMLGLQDLRKKIHHRFTRLHFAGKKVGNLNLKLAEWRALRDVLLYLEYDSLVLRSALGKIDQSLPVTPSIQ